MGLDLKRLDMQHQPNEPRTIDGQGRKVNEPPQCRHDLEAWPCEKRQLIDMIKALTQGAP